MRGGVHSGCARVKARIHFRNGSRAPLTTVWVKMKVLDGKHLLKIAARGLVEVPKAC